MSNTDMTQEQFFDELDELFGTDDGYINHLGRIKEAVSGDTMIRNAIEELKERIKNLRKQENEELKERIKKLTKQNEAYGDMKIKDHPYPTKLRNENEELKKQNAELKELTDGIMNEEGTQHILGCNAYEKFCQAMCELNFDENWISEMKVEHTRLKEESDHIQSDLEDEQEEHQWTQNDLQQLKDDLEPLQEMMDKIKDVNEYKDVVTYVNGLHEKNLELKESAQSTENYWKSKYENEQSTNKMLNEAIINHSEILDDIRQYLSNLDGDEVEVFDRIVASEEGMCEEIVYCPILGHISEYMKSHPGKTFEEAIISEFGDQSEEAKRYGFGVFKKSTD